MPDDYSTIRDAINAQIDPDIDALIQKLQEKEAQLIAKDKEVAMWAKDNRREGRYRDYNHQRSGAYRIPQRRSSSSSGERRFTRNTKLKPKDKGCFLYDSDYRIKDCDLLRKLRKLGKLVTEKARKDSKPGKQKQKAYNANDNISSASSSAESLNIDSDNEEDIEEIAALSKELVSTVPKSD